MKLPIDRHLAVTRLLALVILLLFAASAHAHLGAGPAAGLWHGISHPVSGFDHLAAMLAVGLWAAQRGGQAVWLVPLRSACHLWPVRC